MNERMKLLRLKQKMSQTEFGSHIGLTTSAISDIERGKVKTLTEGNIKLICREFNINETWLRTGKGKMEKDISIEEETYARFGKIMEVGSPIKKNMATMLLKIVETLPDEQWESIYEEFKSCIDRVERAEKESED